MIGYHPAFDPNHAAFRTLVVLQNLPDNRAPVLLLRILDFFLLFPETIPEIRLPRHHQRWRKEFKGLENHYWLDGDHTLTFRQMESVQMAGLGMLAASGLVEPEAFEDGVLALGILPQGILGQIKEKGSVDEPLITFLTTVLAQIPLHGNDGLKARTGLAEFRYDPTS